jgi:hypothetical protein
MQNDRDYFESNNLKIKQYKVFVVSEIAAAMTPLQCIAGSSEVQMLLLYEAGVRYMYVLVEELLLSKQRY